MAAAVAAGIAFTALMCAMYQVCSASGTTCGLIATPVRALLSVGPAAVIAAVSGWLRAARRMRRREVA
jgi:uncharacterized membrane protein YidH (DUF202 family)